ncbi:hypothetical protein RclHR1_12080002 [Rhizophagus clarus]|uniref:Uncharacterized protein n=1 Tax=Rhizophagus clarus TaxID=94130 RepID=A0A2Z6QAV1_9GLOM|nr:hypothetical protein RclHR1_12080002 [Rhizophagus clarus]
MFLVQESLTKDKDVSKDSKLAKTSPSIRDSHITDNFDFDDESELFDPFRLVTDDLVTDDDIREEAAVNTLDDDLAIPSTNIQSAKIDQSQKVSLPEVPAIDTFAPNIQVLDLQLALSQQPTNIITLLSTFSQIVTAVSSLGTLLTSTGVLSNNQHTTNQNAIIDRSSQVNESQLINLFINECKTLFIRICKPTSQLVLILAQEYAKYLGVTTYNAFEAKKRDCE